MITYRHAAGFQVEVASYRRCAGARPRGWAPRAPGRRSPTPALAATSGFIPSAVIGKPPPSPFAHNRLLQLSRAGRRRPARSVQAPARLAPHGSGRPRMHIPAQPREPCPGRGPSKRRRLPDPEENPCGCRRTSARLQGAPGPLPGRSRQATGTLRNLNAQSSPAHLPGGCPAR